MPLKFSSAAPNFYLNGEFFSLNFPADVLYLKEAKFEKADACHSCSKIQVWQHFG